MSYQTEDDKASADIIYSILDADSMLARGETARLERGPVSTASP